MYKFLIGSTLQKKQKELKSFVTHLQQKLVADDQRNCQNKTGNILQPVQEQNQLGCQRTVKRDKIEVKIKLNTSIKARMIIKCVCLLDRADPFWPFGSCHQHKRIHNHFWQRAKPQRTAKPKPKQKKMSQLRHICMQVFWQQVLISNK